MSSSFGETEIPRESRDCKNLGKNGPRYQVTRITRIFQISLSASQFMLLKMPI